MPRAKKTTEPSLEQILDSFRGAENGYGMTKSKYHIDRAAIDGGKVYEMLDNIFQTNSIAKMICEFYPQLALKKGFKLLDSKQNEVFLPPGVYSKIIEGLSEAMTFANLYGLAWCFVEGSDGSIVTIRPDYVSVLEQSPTGEFTKVEVVGHRVAGGEPMTMTNDQLLNVENAVATPWETKRHWPYANDSILTAILDLLAVHDALKATALLYAQTNNLSVVKINGLIKNAGAYEALRQHISRGFSAARNAGSVFALDTENEFEIHSLEMKDYQHVTKTINGLISSAAGIPYEILFGAEQNNNTSININTDSETLPLQVMTQKVQDTQRRMVQFLNRFIGTFFDDEVEVVFPPFLEASESEKLLNARVVIDKLVIAYQANMIPLQTVQKIMKEALGLDQWLDNGTKFDLDMNIVGEGMETTPTPELENPSPPEGEAGAPV